MKNFTEELGINGHLTIIKQYTDGQEEVVFDDHNIIVSGMGVGLTYMFTGSGSNSVLDYQIDRFQVGVSGAAVNEVSSTYQLSGPCTEAEYGAGSNLFIEAKNQITNTTLTSLAAAHIPANKITRIGDSSVRYTLVVDEEACNGIERDGDDMSINEVGLLMKNPTGNISADRPLLVAYRTFSDIVKTSDFSLIFRWTINF